MEIQRHNYSKIIPTIKNQELRADLQKMEDGNVIVEKGIIKLSRELGIPLVATNDAHYVKKDSSKFWKHVSKDLPFTDFLKEYLPIWNTRLPQDGDFLGNWNMFAAPNFSHILFGLGLFDLSAILKECNVHPFRARQETADCFEYVAKSR